MSDLSEMRDAANNFLRSWAHGFLFLSYVATLLCVVGCAIGLILSIAFFRIFPWWQPVIYVVGGVFFWLWSGNAKRRWQAFRNEND